MKKKKEKSKKPPRSARNKKQIWLSLNDKSLLEQRKVERNSNLIFLFGNNETADLKTKSELMQHEISGILDNLKTVGWPETFLELTYALFQMAFILISKKWDEIVELIISDHATYEQC